MGKYLFIAEKPSVARQFADAMKEPMKKSDGFQEGEHVIVTWCFGHLVTMSYPEAYDPALKKWRLDSLPFLPDTFRYEVLPGAAAKQFAIVKKLLNREDVERIYVCTDSGREGEYIYRLVRQMAGVSNKDERRVWINSQTEEEIRRGIREAKPLSDYDHLSDAAYLRAKEDYLMGINFSRALTIKYGNEMASFLGKKYCVVSVGRVMTCVLGMVVQREREIRSFQKTPFYRVTAAASAGECPIELEWRAIENSRFFQSPLLYKENGFREKKDAEQLIEQIRDASGGDLRAKVLEISRKTEKKRPPLLYNLAEIQAECSKIFKISPDKTLNIIQELYEKRMVTYPRTDARVLSTAIAQQIDKNLKGLLSLPAFAPFAKEILDQGLYKNIAATRYTDDAQITDHYALIPTGQATGNLPRLSRESACVYELIVRRFLSIFYPPAVYRKLSLRAELAGESFFASDKYLSDEGYQKVLSYSFRKAEKKDDEKDDSVEVTKALSALRKGSMLSVTSLDIREGETTPPKRYTTGSMILAMENAGKLIEDEEMRETIKDCGIGTSATRADILEKLVTKNHYLHRNNKTQVLTPELLGEMVYDAVAGSISNLLKPDFTASWEKGLNYVAQGTVTEEEYHRKLNDYVGRYTEKVKTLGNAGQLRQCFSRASAYYKGSRTKK